MQREPRHRLRERYREAHQGGGKQQETRRRERRQDASPLQPPNHRSGHARPLQFWWWWLHHRMHRVDRDAGLRRGQQHQHGAAPSREGEASRHRGVRKGESREPPRCLNMVWLQKMTRARTIVTTDARRYIAAHARGIATHLTRAQRLTGFQDAPGVQKVPGLALVAAARERNGGEP